MQKREKNQSLNKELTKILKSFSPQEMWSRQKEISRISQAIKSNNDIIKEGLVNKYKDGI